MTSYAYFEGQIVPLEEAKIGVMTHAFNYGTACFEGIRGNWNADHEQIYLFRPREHFARLQQSCKILRIGWKYDIDELLRIAVKLVQMSEYREDMYIRPLAYKSGHVIGVRMHNIPDDLLMFTSSFGAYIDFDEGARCLTSTYRRVDDLGIPARAKPTGIYINSALAKTEANEAGFDEAIMLTHDGHVSEGSGENIFLVENGRLVTPPPSDNILIGITRATVMELAERELGIPTIERSIDRSELYTADECFMTGTAAHVTPVIEVDRRPVGDGRMGPITRRLSQLYFDAAFGRLPAYAHWTLPVYEKVPVTAHPSGQPAGAD
ncbi:MAG TPA: branched-chain amino acid transaminase [Dehalococcoidia bacterium]|nr:branched-chain amino acid transaminase [Dehalococcoidia bacterium]